MNKKKAKSSVVQFKREICEQFKDYIRSQKITQADLGRKLDLNKALVSKFINAELAETTLDRLLYNLYQIRPDLIPTLKKSSKAKKKKRKNS